MSDEIFEFGDVLRFVRVRLFGLECEPVQMKGRRRKPIDCFWFREPYVDAVIGEYNGRVLVHTIFLYLINPKTGHYDAIDDAEFAPGDRDWIHNEAKRLYARRHSDE